VHAIEQATGTRPSGYNNYWIRPGANTLEILQELGFIYHIDDLSADEPFLQQINGLPFATVPYSVHLNDIASFDFPGFNPAGYEQQMIDEFDQLYAEAATRRRMMVIGPHERLSGHASRVRVLDRILTRLRDHDDVWWAPQRSDRPMGPRPPRHRRLGRPRPSPAKRRIFHSDRRQDRESADEYSKAGIAVRQRT